MLATTGALVKLKNCARYAPTTGALVKLKTCARYAPHTGCEFVVGGALCRAC